MIGLLIYPSQSDFKFQDIVDEKAGLIKYSKLINQSADKNEKQ